MRLERLDPVTFRAESIKARERAIDDGFEICGVLIREECGTISMRPLENLATEPAKWEIRCSWLRAIRKELKPTKRRLVGTFHSHVGGYAYPTEQDLEYYPSGFLMMIYDSMDHRVGMWRPMNRKGRGRLIPIAVLGGTLDWDELTATEYAKMLQVKFAATAKRNQPNNTRLEQPATSTSIA